MPRGAPRLPLRPWRCLARGALPVLGLWLALTGAAAACRIAPDLQGGTFAAASMAHAPGCNGQEPCTGPGITQAWYARPTVRYDHGVLGDTIEGGSLIVYTDSPDANSCGAKRVNLDNHHVFEDTAPRLVDLDGDGRAEVITVRSHVKKGAQLAIWGDIAGSADLELIAATPYIGRAHRWLAPVGAGDLYGDGRMIIAYVDRPHLAHVLRLWQFDRGRLTHIEDFAGLTNHRIGDDYISSGIRTCNGFDEMVLVDAQWQNVVSVIPTTGKAGIRVLAPYEGRTSVERALTCRN